MGYIRSEIKKKDDGLYEVRIFYTSWLFMEQSEHTCKKTIEECEKWLLEKRCKNLNVIEEKSEEKPVSEPVKKKDDDIKVEKIEWPKLSSLKHHVQEGKNHKL